MLGNGVAVGMSLPLHHTMPTLLQQAEPPGSAELSAVAARGEPCLDGEEAASGAQHRRVWPRPPAPRHRRPARAQALPPAQPHRLAPPTGCRESALLGAPLPRPWHRESPAPGDPHPADPRASLFFNTSAVSVCSYINPLSIMRKL